MYTTLCPCFPTFLPRDVNDRGPSPSPTRCFSFRISDRCNALQHESYPTPTPFLVLPLTLHLHWRSIRYSTPHLPLFALISIFIFQLRFYPFPVEESASSSFFLHPPPPSLTLGAFFITFFLSFFSSFLLSLFCSSFPWLVVSISSFF